MANALIVFFLFLAGAGSAAYLVAVIVSFCSRFAGSAWAEAVSPITACGFYLGPAAVLLGTGFLLLDLGAPERAFLVFFTPPASILSFGSWFIVLFCLCAMTSFACDLLFENSISQIVGSFMQVAAALLSIAVMLYSGIYFSLFPAIPFLYTPLIPLLFVVSSLCSGVALLDAFSFFRQDREGVFEAFKRLAVVSIVLTLAELITLAVFLALAYFGTLLTEMSVKALLVGDYAGLFWLGIVAIGIVLPLVSDTLELRIGEALPTSIGAVGSLVGGICLRLGLFFAAIHFSAIDMSVLSFWG